MDGDPAGQLCTGERSGNTAGGACGEETEAFMRPRRPFECR